MDRPNSGAKETASGIEEVELVVVVDEEEAGEVATADRRQLFAKVLPKKLSGQRGSVVLLAAVVNPLPDLGARDFGGRGIFH